MSSHTIKEFKDQVMLWISGDILGISDIERQLSNFLTQARASSDDKVKEEIRKAMNFACGYLLQNHEENIPTLPRAKLYFWLGVAGTLEDEDEVDHGKILGQLGVAKALMQEVSFDLNKHGVRNRVPPLIEEVEEVERNVRGK